jgi:hypothetical protein
MSLHNTLVMGRKLEAVRQGHQLGAKERMDEITALPLNYFKIDRNKIVLRSLSEKRSLELSI